MVNTNKLNDIINSSGLKRTAIAKSLNISLHALSNKINNISEFKLSEMTGLERMLNLDPETSKSIFFCHEVDGQSTRVAI